MLPSLSVIITTYNWPQALQLVLASLKAQQYFAKTEIIIADDGSSAPTAACIEKARLQTKVPIQHIWQPDQGFRAAKARNQAIFAASHDYILFLDGDCVVPKNFLLRHAQLATPHHFVAGNRILLSQSISQQLLVQQTAIFNWSYLQWLKLRLSGKCNRVLPLLGLPLGPLRQCRPWRWQGVKTCNLGVWRAHLWAINGFEEKYTGWGFEDSDLVIRLQKQQIRRKDGHFSVPVWHLWHPQQSRVNAQQNYAKLQLIQNSAQIKAMDGLDQYVR